MFSAAIGGATSFVVDDETGERTVASLRVLRQLIASRRRVLLLLVALSVSTTATSAVRAQNGPHPVAARQDAALQPGDRVQLRIWREPDLSGEFAVGEGGIVVFPKIGPLHVASLSIDSLTRTLTTRYSVSLRNPAVEVTALRRINVVGAVRNPGFFYADPTVTVNGTLALAGGVTMDGDQKRIELVRAGHEIPISIGVDRGLADSAVQSGDNIRVPERSWISRNTALIASGITGAALVIAAVIRP